MAGRILVPLDGSSFSETAIPAAIRAAQKLKLPLELVTVVPAPVGLVTETAEKYLGATARTLEAVPDLNVSWRLLVGAPAPVLIEQTVKDAPTMIVMTSHGRGAISRFILGSVTDQLLRQSRVPLLVVRSHDGEAKDAGGVIRRVLVPIDGSPNAELIMEPLLGILGDGPVELQFIHVVALPPIILPFVEGTVPSEAAIEAEITTMTAYLEALANRWRTDRITITTEVAAAEVVATRLLEAAGLGGADLIAMTTRGKTGVTRAVLGSVADKLIRSASVPVLAWNP